MPTDAVVPFGTPVPAGVLSPEAALQFIADSRVNRDADDQINICWPEYGEAQMALRELRRFAEYHGDRPPATKNYRRSNCGSDRWRSRKSRFGTYSKPTRPSNYSPSGP
jgi:hypothetical protein